jgi:hypothetical protein
MSEITLVCPNCESPIVFDETLAGPLIKATQDACEELIAAKDEEARRKEQAIHERESSVAKAEQDLELRLAVKLEEQRKQIVDSERQRAALRVSAELDEKTRSLEELQRILREKDAKLADAAKAQAETLRKERELSDAKREIEFTIERKVSGELDGIRARARVEAEEQFRLKIIEKDEILSSVRRQIEDLKRRVEQGSQQLQGEVQELELESLLCLKFPHDLVKPVPKGEYGGDVIHIVRTAQGADCGSILWESKRTKNWSDGWLEKLRSDQRQAKAEISILVTHVLPKGIESWGFLWGGWGCVPRVNYKRGGKIPQNIFEVY